MCPNLYLAIVSPVSTLKPRPKQQLKSSTSFEHWDTPVPGTYSHVPGRGWFLIHRDDEQQRQEKPEPVVYCRILHRYLLSSELEQRCQWHRVVVVGGGERQSGDWIEQESDRPKAPERNTSWSSSLSSRSSRSTKSKQSITERTEQIRFFQLDDGVAWVPGWDSQGRFILGPYRKWCFDKEEKSMRPMMIDEESFSREETIFFEEES